MAVQTRGAIRYSYVIGVLWVYKSHCEVLPASTLKNQKNAYRGMSEYAFSKYSLGGKINY